MAYKSYFRRGNPQDEEHNPTPGNQYWVVLQTATAEAAFQAVLKTSIKRDHQPTTQDTMPSYHFENGIVLHGTGIRFYRKMPKKPLKGLWLGKIFRHKEGSPYELSSKVMDSDHQTAFSTLAELKDFLDSLDIDTQSIPSDDFVGSRDCELLV
jgi:hypothetical protein